MPGVFDRRAVAAAALLAGYAAACVGSPPAPIESTQSRVRPFSMARTLQWTLKSTAGRTFEISVALPEGTAPASGYPALYVLDANTSFVTLADMVRNHEPMFGPVVVVGVGYPSDAEIANRIFDLSPPTDPTTLPVVRPEGWGAVGGADAFFAFLQNELKPAVEKMASIDESRQALFGHSLGGIFALHVLFTHPEAFDTYIAGSPAIWWGRRSILKEAPEFQALQAQSGARRRLLITVGELESGPQNPEEVRLAEKLKLINPQAMRRETHMVDNAAALARELAPLSSAGLQVSFVRFPDETHTSVIPAYLSRGARFTLRGWFD